ncbi:MAG: flagellar basal body P-ring protein FlgI [Polyangiaceae bacterium]
MDRLLRLPSNVGCRRRRAPAWLRAFGLWTLVVTWIWSNPARAEAIRDIADVAGARENQLVGYGLVSGLAGTGDDVSVPFAGQSTLSLVRRLGIQVEGRQLRLRNVAAVIVTATLPAFSKPGTKVDVTVSSLGNARSLAGGTLVQAMLKGSDQTTYAVAQGNVVTGGFEARGASGSSIRAGATTTGRIPEGAIVEREVPAEVVSGGFVTLDLRTPGFSVAARTASAIDEKLGTGSARAVDGGAVVVKVPADYTNRNVELIALLEDIQVSVVRRARVVVSERTGTIVAGGDIRVAPVALVHGNLTITVKERPEVSQPNAGPLLGRAVGSTVVVPRSELGTNEGDKKIRYLGGATTLADVAALLGTLGLAPRELSSVFQALRSAGALEAEVVINERLRETVHGCVLVPGSFGSKSRFPCLDRHASCSVPARLRRAGIRRSPPPTTPHVVQGRRSEVGRRARNDRHRSAGGRDRSRRRTRSGEIPRVDASSDLPRARARTDTPGE